MPSQKEILLFEMKRLRSCVQTLEDAKAEVVNSVDLVVNRVLEELSKVETIAASSDLTQQRQMSKVLRNATTALREFEESLTAVDFLYEDQLELVLSAPKTPSKPSELKNDSLLPTPINTSMVEANSLINDRAEPNRETQSIVPSASAEVAHLSIGQRVADRVNGGGSSEQTGDNVQQTQVGSIASSSQRPVSGIDSPRRRIIVDDRPVAYACQKSTNLPFCTRAQVEVSHIESPSLFWVKFKDGGSNLIRDTLNDHLLLVGSRQLEKPQKGDYCAAQLGQYYERAKVLEIQHMTFGNSFAKILLIDTGMVTWVACYSLMELPIQFREFRRQAIPCFLYGVVPMSGFWSEVNIATLGQLCSTKNVLSDRLEVYVLGNLDASIYSIMLYRITSDDSGGVIEENINQRLVDLQTDVKRSGLTDGNWFEKDGSTPIGGFPSVTY